MLLLTSLALAQEPAANSVDLTQSALHDETLLAAIGTEDLVGTEEPLNGEQLVQTEIAPFTMEEIFSQEQGLTAVSPMASSTGLGGTWIWIAGLAGLGLAFTGRKFLSGKLGSSTSSTSKLLVLDSKGLSANSSLMLVEVETSDGGRRRLLVGIGQGAPTLVADLGGDVPGFPTMPELEGIAALAEFPEAQEHQDREAFKDVFREEISIAEEPKQPLSGKFTDADLAPLDDAPAIAAGVSRKSALASMASQSRATLGQRNFAGSQWSKVVDPPRSPAEAAKRLESRRALVSSVLDQRAA